MPEVTTVVFDKRKLALAVGFTIGVGVAAGTTYWIIKKRREKKNTVVIINDPAVAVSTEAVEE